MQALGHLEHGSGRLGVVATGLDLGGVHNRGLDHRSNRGHRGYRGGGYYRSAFAQLGNASVSSLELSLELSVFVLQVAHSLDDLVKELVNFVLVVALTELGGLELLVEDVISG